MQDIESSDPASSPVPRLTIGLPVYNGERFIRSALDSLLAQTFQDFELIISDNASTDGTEEICRAYAEKDERVRYVRQERNLGAAGNFNWLFHQARGEYFKWASHDDVIAPDFVERCIAALEADSGLVLAFTRGRQIDEHGLVQKHHDKWDNSLRIDDPRPHVRFRDSITVPHRCFAAFGVFRTTVLRETPLIARHVGSDRTLLSELALRGRWRQVPEYLFDLREHSGTSQRAMATDRDRMAWFDTSTRARIGFPVWRELGEYINAVRRAPLTGYERVLSFLQLGRWLFSPTWYRQKWFFLMKDLVTGAGLGLRLVIGRDTGRRSRARAE